jgi:hypothetical protein
MSENTETTESTTPEEYEPPAAAWRALDLMKAAPEEVAARIIDCARCPVNLSCMESNGGSGYVCKLCRSTSVLVGEENAEGYQYNALVLDCYNHKFSTENELTKCALCSGALSAVDKYHANVKHHILLTVHAKRSAKERIKELKVYLDRVESKNEPR